MNIYKLIVQYKGTRFLGFQVQSQGETIQGQINQALKTLTKAENTKSVGSGRTDAGVHALAQVVRIEIPINVPEDGLMRGLNSLLPLDIRIVKAERCTLDFHPIFSARSKEYNYVFSNNALISPFATELITHFPFDLNIELMKEGCKIFCGEHDFINYQCTGTNVASTVRTIHSCQLEHFSSEGHWKALMDDYYVLKIVGSGFLKQMVRLMMGALWSLGREKITLEDLKKSLNGPCSSRLGATAPPQGLYLVEVHY